MRIVSIKSTSILFVVMFVAFAFVTDAAASHYDLADIEIVPTKVRDQLIEAGVKDTKGLLERMLTNDGRKEITKLTGMERKEVDSLARMLELMQVTGVGPKAARLLQLSGVESIGDLAQRDPAQLLPLVLDANAKHAVTGIDPDEIVLEDWIKKAAAVPVALEP